MTIIVVNGLNELTTVLMLASVLMSNTQFENESKKNNTKPGTTTTSGKKRGRPRKVVVETQKQEQDLIEKSDRVYKNQYTQHCTPCGERKQRHVPTLKVTFFNTKEEAMKQCLKADLPYTEIMKIRPTRAIDDKTYPCFYYLKNANYSLQKLTIAARHQYIEMWNARHHFKLPSAISVSISSKQVFKKKKN